jgi:hypothetical protein
MRKSHLNDEFLVLLGPIISRLFTCSNAEKKGACSSPISMVLPSLSSFYKASFIALNKSVEAQYLSHSVILHLHVVINSFNLTPADLIIPML